MVLPRRLIVMLLLPIFFIVVGTVGFYFLDPGKSLFDSLYLTIITLTTIGFGDVLPETTASKWFVMFLALGGIFTLFYVGAELVRAVVSGEVRATLGRQRMEESLATLKDHLVICGFGRMGQLVAREFEAHHYPFVVIEREAALLTDFNFKHGHSVVGDSTSDEVLKHAGVHRAKSLVTVLGSDADNLFITMSARLLNDKLYIVSRAEDELAEKKLIRGGANRVVSPYAIGGHRVAHAVLRPTVVEFLELATRSEHLEIQMEEVRIAVGSKLAGVTLQDSRIRQDIGVIIVAIMRPGGHMIFNPPPETAMLPGDILITLGPKPKVDQLEKLAKGP